MSQNEDLAVSVIVPAHNAGAGIARLLGALSRQTLSQSYEIIVVDDGSTDSTPEHLRRWPRVRHVCLEARRGSYAARNAGLAIARGSVVAFTDADCTPTPSWLERGLHAVESGIDLVAGRIEVELPQRPSIAALVDSTRFLDQEFYATQGFGATANLLVRRSVFDRVGHFNPRLISGGDREFGMRATDTGATIRYVPDALVIHESRSTLRALTRKSVRIGRGLASQRRYAYGPLGALSPPPWRRHLYVPPRRVPGFHRLNRPLPPHRRVLLHAVDYFAVQLPIAVGILGGSVRNG
jgi:glycosyltransferase involved in cell wall biosynthesis